MKSLTVIQPYTSLIISCNKRVENRVWATSHRGPVAIHAGKSRKRIDDGRTYPQGVVLGAAILVDCDTLAELPARYPYLIAHPHAKGPCRWVFDNPQPFDRPVLARGKLQLWGWPQATLLNDTDGTGRRQMSVLSRGVPTGAVPDPNDASPTT